MSRIDEFLYQLGQEGGWFLWLIGQPLWVVASIILGSGLMLTVGGILLTHNYVTSQRLIGNNLVATAKFSFMSQVFTGLLAFMMVEAGTRYANAEALIYNETQALRNLTTLVGHFPGATAGQFQGRVADYGRAVVETEWQRMKAGNDSPFATAAFENLVRTYFSIDPANEQQQSMLTLGNLFMAQAVEARTNRLNNNISQDIATLTWVSLTGLVGITIAFNWFFGSPTLRSQLSMGILLGICILSSVVMIFLLGNPFAGDTAVSAAPFRELYP
jgi:hypothetical protein